MHRISILDTSLQEKQPNHPSNAVNECCRLDHSQSPFMFQVQIFSHLSGISFIELLDDRSHGQINDHRTGVLIYCLVYLNAKVGWGHPVLQHIEKACAWYHAGILTRQNWTILRYLKLPQWKKGFDMLRPNRPNRPPLAISPQWTSQTVQPPGRVDAPGMQPMAMVAVPGTTQGEVHACCMPIPFAHCKVSLHLMAARTGIRWDTDKQTSKPIRCQVATLQHAAESIHPHPAVLFIASVKFGRCWFASNRRNALEHDLWQKW